MRRSQASFCWEAARKEFTLAKEKKSETAVMRARPVEHQTAHEFQPFNQTVPMPIALPHLNQLLADMLAP